MPRIHRRTITKSTSKPGESTHHRKYNYTRPKQGTPQVSSVHITTTNTPAETTSETQDVGTNVPSFTSTPSMVMLAAAALLVASQWDGFFAPLWNQLWNDPTAKSMPYKVSINLIIGAVVFIAAIGFIASISEDAAGVMILMLLAMWLLWIMFNGQQQVTSFFDFLAGNSSPAKTAAAPTAANTANTAKGR